MDMEDLDEEDSKMNLDLDDGHSPLDFLAQASSSSMDPYVSKWTTTGNGKERIVVPGPSGSSRMHKGRLQGAEARSSVKKCRNRECNNVGGQPGKPRSIYCSKRCQSREQNLRQGRIKNVRSPVLGHSGNTQQSQQSSRDSPPMLIKFESSSVQINSPPRNSPSPLSMGRVPSPGLSSISPSPSPVPSSSPGPSLPSSSLNSLTSPSPSPIMMLAPSSSSLLNIIQSPLHMPLNLAPSPSLLHTLPPSPLTLRLGMTPSPLPISNSPFFNPLMGERPSSDLRSFMVERPPSSASEGRSLNSALEFRAREASASGSGSSASSSIPPPGTFAPIPMSSSIPNVNATLPLFSPKPTPSKTTQMPAPAPVRPSPVNLSSSSNTFSPPMVPVKKEKNASATSSSSFSTSTSQNGTVNGTSARESLTLAPMLS